MTHVKTVCERRTVYTGTDCAVPVMNTSARPGGTEFDGAAHNVSGTLYGADTIDTGDDMDCCTFSSVRGLLTTSLCDRERNAQFLRAKPWRPLGSWALFYALGFDLDGGRYILVPISNAMLDDWNVDADELHREAVANAQALSPAWLERADSGPRPPEMARCNLLESGETPGSVSGGPYRLSNRTGTNGASVIGWDGILERTSEILGGDFVIVPFSVHEVLILPAADVELDLSVWRSGLHLFNASPQVMPPEDVLSDSLQIYEHATGLLRAV